MLVLINSVVDLVPLNVTPGHPFRGEVDANVPFVGEGDGSGCLFQPAGHVVQGFLGCILGGVAFFDQLDDGVSEADFEY